MKKQKKQTLLTAIMIILIIILITMIGSIVYEEVMRVNKQKIEDTIVPEIKEEGNIIEEDVVEEIPTDKEGEDETIENNNFVGEEEQEIQNDEVEKDTTKSKDEKAIELAQEEWGDDDSVTFSVEKKKDTKYYVAVKSSATVLQWYEIDTETWEISEY